LLGSTDPESVDRESDTKVAAIGDLKCEACPSGGSYGSTAMYSVNNQAMCQSCAVKTLGIGHLTGAEQNNILRSREIEPK
jgi:hypothetical protein